MRTYINHLLYSADPKNLDFYRDLFGFLGWTAIHDEHDMLGFSDGAQASIWVGAATKSNANDYDASGLNHLGIGAESISDVDATAEHLRGKGVELLFETPRHRPDFGMGDDQTYYQVMFESPDKILLEVVYTGPV